MLDDLDRPCAGLMAQELLGDFLLRPRIPRRLVHWPVLSSRGSAGAAAAEPLGSLYRDFLALHDRIYGHATEQPAATDLRSVHRAGGSDRLDEGDEPDRRRST